MVAYGSSSSTHSSNPTVNEDLVRSIESRTARQVQDLRVDCDGRRIRVTGRSKTYYIKQLVTHAIRDMIPAMPLANEICVS